MWLGARELSYLGVWREKGQIIGFITSLFLVLMASHAI